jgi:NAD(P)-dependent dehydrogenase (short-subunit alcohol dehydrogenase family)
MSTMKGKAAFITGGNAGLGRAAAVAFAKRGVNVLVAARREAEGEETVRMVNDAGAPHGAAGKFVRCDVLHEEQIVAAINACRVEFGRLDYAFNNAGVLVYGKPTTEATADDYAYIFDINVRGVLLSMKHQIPAMLETVGAEGGAAIVNCASVAGLVGTPDLGIYGASKHAVIGLTKTAALELAQSGVRVNAVAPAVIETDMADQLHGDDPEAIEWITAMHPMGRFGVPDEVAGAVVWLCSPEASFITGQTLPIDGGYLAK